MQITRFTRLTRLRKVRRSDAHKTIMTKDEVSKCNECERLMKIIQKELCENDDLGCEYSYIIALKMKVRDLETLIDDLRGDVEFLQDENKSLFLELEDVKRRESTFLK